LDTAIDMLNAQPPLVQRLVGQLLLQRQLLTARLLRRHEDLHVGQRERQEAEILQQPTPGWEWVGSGLRNTQIMHTAAVGVTEKEDEEQGIDEQDIFHGVVFFLAAITVRLCRRGLGADDAPCGAVMGTREEAGAAAGAGASSSGTTMVAASASETPRRRARADRERAGHRRGRAAPPAVRARGGESTDWLCPGPCRISARAPPGGQRF